jgi:hypothetical protein
MLPWVSDTSFVGSGKTTGRGRTARPAAVRAPRLAGRSCANAVARWRNDCIGAAVAVGLAALLAFLPAHLSVARAGPVAHPWQEAIGRINVAGYRQRSWCTGTLVAPQLVLTAAHCLTRDAAGQLPRPGRVHFVIGEATQQIAAHGIARRFIAPAESLATAGGHPELARDILLIELEQPLASPLLPLDDAPVTRGETLLAAGFFRDRPYALTLAETCRLLAADQGLWRTDCPAEPGASGGPVLRLRDGEPRVAAVLVAKLAQGGSLAVPVSTILPLLDAAQRTPAATPSR